MKKYLFEGDYKNTSRDVRIKLLLIHFEDENNIHFIYSPHLDLSGYGVLLNDAKKSFEIAFEDFVDYTLKKKTLNKVLASLGWNIKGNKKKSKKIIAPSIAAIINENEYVSEIFDKYPVNTYHQEVGFPLSA